MILRSSLFIIVSLSELVTSGNSVRKFAQISDIHLDIEYRAGGDVLDSCHKTNITLSEAEGGASKYGDFKCDSPKKLVLSAINYLKTKLPDPDFILWTGDSSPHWKNDNERKWREVYSNLKWITRALHQKFPNTTIIPALGNHDSHPADFFPDPSINATLSKRIYSGYIEQGSLGDLLRDYPDAKNSFKRCGFYAIRKQNYTENVTQTFLVLNTNLYYSNKAKNYEADPCGQFKWLREELQNSKENERVFIVGHVPPGYFELHPEKPFFTNDAHTKSFTQIVSEKKAAQKIVAHFYGHSHTDAIRLFLSNDGNIRGSAFLAPSVTPLMFEGGVNPSVRIYEYDPENRTILNYETHYLPLESLLVPNSSKVIDETVSPEDGGDNGEAKSRRKNSKFLERRRRQVATTESNPPSAKDNNDKFEDLITESTVLTTTVLNSTTSTPEPETETTTLTDREDATEPTTEAYENRTDVSTVPTPTDKDVIFLVSQWTLGYDKRASLGLSDVSSKSLYKFYTKIRNDQSSMAFKNYFRETWVHHDPKDRMECNETCHQTFICAMVHFSKEDFVDCTSENGVIQSTFPPTQSDIEIILTTATTSEPSATTSFYPQITTPFRSGPWSKTTSSSSVPSAGFGTVADSTEPTLNHGESNVIRGVAIGFAGVVLIAIAGFSFAFYRKTRINRYRSQEFLLTDSVFRYDGYSQVEQP